MTVTPIARTTTPRRLDVTIHAPVGTFFMRVLGIESIPVTRSSAAEFTLPVPMGSPENYYGVFGLTRGLTTTETVPVITHPQRETDDEAADAATPANTSTGWSSSSSGQITSDKLRDNIEDEDSAYAFATVNGRQQQWLNFGFTFPLTNSGNVTEVMESIDGIEVVFEDVRLSNNCPNQNQSANRSRVDVDLNWNGGTAGSWTSVVQGQQLDDNDDNYVLGDDNSLSMWGSHVWSTNDFSNGNFRVRFTAVKGASCNANVQLRVDQMRVIVHYTVRRTVMTAVTTDVPDENLQGPGGACPGGVANCFVSTGANLNPRGFWGDMNTQGSPNVNGDAYLPFYDTSGGTASPACGTPAAANRACYDPRTYYNYAIVMPPGSTGGTVYVYDPTFCDVDVDKGTGDRLYDDDNAVSAFYELYDTKNTLYDMDDDGAAVANSGALFRNMRFSDTTMGGTGDDDMDECRSLTSATYGDARDYHNRWYRLYSNMSGGATGRVYRLHTTTTDPASASAQRNSNGQNGFAIYASASGGTPKVHGLGAMQAFTPLKASSSGGSVNSEFYLAQIEEAHEGKTVEIKLWDPGDTDPLSASLQILIPTSGGWAPTPVTYSAALGTTNSGRADGGSGDPDCRTFRRTTPSSDSISTFSSGAPTDTGRFNGCWLTIVAVVPAGYDAPQDGWWKIRYTMTGSGTSSDVTTWQVAIRGNPVHLILPGE